MATMFMQRKGDGLFPASALEASQVEGLPVGVPLRVEVKRPRSGKHHRLMWAIFSAAADALNNGPASDGGEWDAERVCDVCKVGAGYAWKRRATAYECEANGVPHGSWVMSPASISFKSMDETEFRKFAMAACRYLSELAPYWLDSPAGQECALVLAEHGVDVRATA